LRGLALAVIVSGAVAPRRGAVEHHYRATVRARVVAELLDPLGS
jgi:hypothetical protein